MKQTTDEIRPSRMNGIGSSISKLKVLLIMLPCLGSTAMSDNMQKSDFFKVLAVSNLKQSKTLVIMKNISNQTIRVTSLVYEYSGNEIGAEEKVGSAAVGFANGVPVKAGESYSLAVDRTGFPVNKFFIKKIKIGFSSPQGDKGMEAEVDDFVLHGDNFNITR